MKNTTQTTEPAIDRNLAVMGYSSKICSNCNYESMIEDFEVKSDNVVTDFICPRCGDFQGFSVQINDENRERINSVFDGIKQYSETNPGLFVFRE